jgi:Asp-tRNA(Asn)/Glu-tRNA(Gln) amidotransferase B subunit
MTKYQLSPGQASQLVAERSVADAFEEHLARELERKLGPSVAAATSAAIRNPATTFEMLPSHLVVASSAKSMMSLISTHVFSYANEWNQSAAEIMGRIDLSSLLRLTEKGVISARMIKEIFVEMLNSGKSADDIVKEKGLRQISDISEIEALVEKVIADNPEKAAEVRAGNDKLMGWFVGQVMRASRGKANPKLVNDALRIRLSPE